MTAEHRKRWKCPACYRKMPKTGNLDAPVGPKIVEENHKSPESNNVTLRKNMTSQNNDTLSSEEDISLLGDTICPENAQSNEQTELTLQSITSVITRSLQENNNMIIIQLQNTIQTEVQKAIQLLRAEYKQDICNLKEENKNTMIEMQQLNEKINKLQLEHDLLQKDINSFKTQNPSTNNNRNNENYCKKFVLFGLEEYYKEPECDLYDRIHELFWNLMKVDLRGYIEDAYRIGRYNKNGNRPLVVELISKRMVKYLIDSSGYLYKTGISISEFLDRSSRLERKALREKMLLARKNGLHAVLRNNQLYIEGKITNINEYPDSSEAPNQQNYTEKENLSPGKNHQNIHTNGHHHSFRKNATAFAEHVQQTTYNRSSMLRNMVDERKN
ncbi:hypothetical protein ABMA27_007693 [Loxostege sticticalis]|uniref:Uncharacterized protein n=1 Tax=Loxostege sticticalis TaxID=481309 RepID=A0ABR3HGA8_LOXSC